MARENFYLLLGLSLNPPETDLEKIETAIRKLQAQWSRFRNHPTKGIQAKKRIGLIPEMLKVMKDPKLRQQEALAAQKQLAQRQQARYIEVDRHIKIHMSKGYITNEEAFNLAQKHGISKNQIQERIKRLKQQIISEIDKNLEFRQSKGYLTEDEILKLAKRYSVKPEAIRKRVKRPIKKTGKTAARRVKPIDETILQLISDNLKIVGSSSLYEFLDMPSSADLKGLQKKAKNKKAELLKAGKKDAIITASEILAGQCISIFKSEERRKAYDLSQTQSQLNALNSDIDVAGMGGKIRTEYFDVLVKTGVDYGMDREEAVEYIKNYCLKKNWAIEKKTTTQKPSKKLLAIVAVVVLICLAGIPAGMWFVDGQKTKKEYQAVVTNINRQTDPKLKVGLLEQYLDSHPGSKYAADALERLNKTLIAVEKQDYQAAMQQIAQLPIDPSYETKAKSIYRSFLNTYPTGTYAPKVKMALNNIATVAQDHHYAALKQTSYENDFQEINAYHHFLGKNPDSKYLSQIQQRLATLSENHFRELKIRLTKFESEKNWENCKQACDQFLDHFHEGRQAEEVRRLKNLYIEKQVVTKLMARAESAELSEGQAMIKSYLKSNTTSADKELLLNKLREMEARSKALSEWQSKLTYARNPKIDLQTRIRALENYVHANPRGFYVESAKKLLGSLKHQQEKEIQNQIQRAQRRQQQAQLARLQQEREQQQRHLTRVTQEKEKTRLQLKQVSNRYALNPDETVTDRRTGLTWTLLDSRQELGQCLSHPQAQNYLINLRSGSHRDWRMPKAGELASIYKSPPFFPTEQHTWYWTGESFWQGYNKRVYVVTSQPETQFKRQHKGANDCGVIRAVRP
jgi:hypothetical protein